MVNSVRWWWPINQKLLIMRQLSTVSRTLLDLVWGLNQNFYCFRCDGESFCDIEVNSGVFGDPCPNTHKYVEVHYACSSQQGNSGGTTTKKLPPWFLEGSAGSLWTSETLPQVPQKEVQKEISGSVSQIPQKPSPRKPILVAQDVIQTTPVPPSGTTPRIPITTPKNGESDTTTIRVDLTPSNREDTTTPSLASAGKSQCLKITKKVF